ncbi:hypothetical protein HPY86_07955 [candidate division WOR-3 bacterium]|nr:hypothetical protein [candidate division WOR-3 bacterium]
MRKKKTQICDCTELKAWAALYVEGEAPATIRQHLLLHIQTCRACAQLVRSLQRTVDFCRLQPGCHMPAQAHEKLWDTLNKHLKRKK